MMPREAKKAYAAVEKLDATLDRIAQIPPHELTLEERLTLWANLERLRLMLTDAVQRGQRAS